MPEQVTGHKLITRGGYPLFKNINIDKMVLESASLDYNTNTVVTRRYIFADICFRKTVLE